MSSLVSEFSDRLEDWPTLIGLQDAEYLLFDEGDQSLADSAVELARRIKRAQMPWQEDGLRGVLTTEPDGRWTHPTCVFIVPRQNGKTLSAAELRIVFGAFHLGETIVYTAQRWRTARAIYMRVKALINGVPSLKKRAFGWTCSQGSAGFTVRHDDGTETEIVFVTRSGDFRGPDKIDLVIYDEAYNLTDAEMAAISPTQMASKNPQTIYLSSAVNQEIHPNGQMLANLRGRALAAIKRGVGRARLYYREHCAPEPDPNWTPEQRRAVREDPATWVLANPSYGVIQDEDKVRKLLLELSARSFEAEVLGWGDWPPTGDETTGPLAAVWGDNADPAPALVSPWPQVLGVDRSPVSKTWVVAGATRRLDGYAHAEIGFCAKASITEVAEWIVNAVTDANPDAIVIDALSSAAALIPYLIERGIEPTTTNGSELAVACDLTLEAAKDRQLSHSDQRVLNDSASVAIKVEMSGKRFKWGALTGGVIAPVMALTLAHWGLLTFARPPKPPPPPLADRSEVSENRSHEVDFDPMTAAF